MAHVKTEYKWYDLGPVVSQNAWFNVICGERGVGKTFGFIKRAIKRGIEYGEEFVYLRRYQREMKSSRANFFNELSSWFPDHEFKVDGTKGFWRELGTKEWTPLVHFVTLANTQAVKSSNFSKVRQIIFDEFILEKGILQYLPDEVNTLLGLYETIDRRQKRCRVYMLGNSASSSNPYFIEWDIRPTDMEEYTLMGDGFLFVHIANSAEYQKQIADTPFGRFVAGSDFGKYAGENQFLDSHNALIGHKPAHATPQWNLETKYGIFSAWVDPKNGTYYMQEDLIGWDLPTLTLLPEKMDETRVLVDTRSRILARVRTAYRRGGSMYYDTGRTRNGLFEGF